MRTKQLPPPLKRKTTHSGKKRVDTTIELKGSTKIPKTNPKTWVKGDWFWNSHREKAALLIAHGDYTMTAIAAHIGYKNFTLSNWMRVPEFKARIEEHREAFRQEVLRRGIADKIKRVSTIVKDFDRTEAIIEERAASPEMKRVPGGKSGLLTHTVKQIGFGKNAEMVDEYRFDAALISARTDLRQAVAKELGQLVDQAVVAVIVKRIIGVADADI